MSVTCVHCGIHREYYTTEENACRQNCRVSDNGYHDFQVFSWCWWWRRRRTSQHKQLLGHRRERRPNTI